MGTSLPFMPSCREAWGHISSLLISWATKIEVYHTEIKAGYSRHDTRLPGKGTFYRGVGPTPGLDFQGDSLGFHWDSFRLP